MKFHKKVLTNYANAYILMAKLCKCIERSMIMYYNLKAELARKNVTAKQVANVWGVHENTAYKKIKLRTARNTEA